MLLMPAVEANEAFSFGRQDGEEAEESVDVIHFNSAPAVRDVRERVAIAAGV